MSFPGLPANLARQAQLASLAPLDAARTLLRFDFWIDEEPALFFAMRRDPRITLNDDAMMALFDDLAAESEFSGEPLEELLSPEAFLEMLAEASQPPPTRRR